MKKLLRKFRTLFSKKETIFRVENKHGEGPYIGNFCFEEEYGFDFERHPLPDNDGIDFDYFSPGHMLFAFSSLDQLFNWFNEDERLFLGDMQFKIVQIVIHKKYVQYGYRQCAFDSRFARAKKLIRMYDTV